MTRSIVVVIAALALLTTAAQAHSRHRGDHHVRHVRLDHSRHHHVRRRVRSRRVRVVHLAHHQSREAMVITCDDRGCSDRFISRRYPHPVSLRGSTGLVTTIGGRPSACRGIPWCGCYLALHLGLPRHGRLNLDQAIAWRHVGEAASGPGERVIVVWPHHVGIIEGRTVRGWIVRSGNDGHAIRDRVRSLRGVVAFRRLNSQMAER